MPRHKYDYDDRAASLKKKTIMKTDENYKAAKITVFVNGDENDTGVAFAVCRDKYPEMESLLDEIARKVDCRFTIQKMYTIDGKVVKDVDRLKDGGEYVVTNGGKIIKIDYGGQNRKPTWGAARGDSETSFKSLPKPDDGYESDPPKHRSKGKGSRHHRDSASPKMSRSKSYNGKRDKSRRRRSESEESSDDDRRRHRGGRRH